MKTYDLTVTPIASNDRYIVASQCCEIMFRDNATVGVHAVWQNGAPTLMLRAIRFGDSFLIVDVSHLARELAEELPTAHTRDAAGLVFFTLRTRFANANEVINKAIKHARAILPAFHASNQAQAVAA